MASPTPNKGMTYPAHGGAVNAWDTPLNTNFDQLDSNLGGSYPVTLGSTIAGATFNSSYATISSTVTTATINSSLAQNLYYKFTGGSTANLTFTMPAIGSLYIFDNQSTGVGTLTINTAAVGSSGKLIASGGNNIILTDGTDAKYAPQNLQAKLYGNSSSPTQLVAGSAAAANGSLNDVIWDYTNWQLYPCTTTGTSATAVYTAMLDRIVPQGTITLSTDALTPVLAADATAKTAVYYTPLTGAWTLLSNGTTTYPYLFSQMALTLTAGAHAASSIYDIFIYANPTSGVISPVIGTGPAWTTATAGAGARGTGAGTSQLSRFKGVLTNTVQVTLTNGASTYTCPANQGVYLGSIFMDAAAGQVSCYTSWGQSRKWGVWNYFNRRMIQLLVGDSTTSWAYTSATVRQSRATTANKLTIFCGFAEETATITFLQRFGTTDPTDNTTIVSIGIGVNSTTAATGTIAVQDLDQDPNVAYCVTLTEQAQCTVTPFLGINNINSLESGDAAGTVAFFGTESYMRLTAMWMG